jgi:hypothetical protein
LGRAKHSDALEMAKKLVDKTPSVIKRWAKQRATHPAVAMAIHAISSGMRSPDAIWAAPTPAEWDQVVEAVRRYVEAGIFERPADNLCHWGFETIFLEREAGDR